VRVVEELLLEAGVKRLVLPAVASVQHTWAHAFGFHVCEPHEKLSLCPLSILLFPGTTLMAKAVSQASLTTCAGELPPPPEPKSHKRKERDARAPDKRSHKKRVLCVDTDAFPGARRRRSCHVVATSTGSSQHSPLVLFFRGMHTPTHTNTKRARQAFCTRS
jgi:hypothetical protein